jgi:hypothetical protein
MIKKPITSIRVVRKVSPPPKVAQKVDLKRIIKKIPDDMKKGLTPILVGKLQAVSKPVESKSISTLVPIKLPKNQTLNDVEGLKLWLDAAQFKGMNNQGVNKWKNNALNSTIFLENTSNNKKTLPRVIENGLNGLPILDFKPEQNMELNKNFRSNDYTLIFLARQVGKKNRRFINGNANRTFGYWSGAKNQLYVEGWVSVPGLPSSNNNWDLYTIRRTNGYTLMSRFGEKVVKPVRAGSSFDGLYINTGGCCGGESSDGQVAEIALWNRNLTNSEVEKVEGYMAWKWGLQNDLDESHVYLENPSKYNIGLVPIKRKQYPNQKLNLISDLRIWFDASKMDSIKPISEVESFANTKKSYSLINDGPLNTKPMVKQKVLNKLSVLQFTKNQNMKLNRSLIANEFTLVFLTRQTGGKNGRFITGNENRFFGYWNGAKDQLHLNNWLTPAGNPKSNTKWDIYVVFRKDDGKTYMTRNGNTSMIAKGGVASNFDGLFLNSSETSDAQFAELALWKRALTKQEIQKVEGYLAWKWGLNAELPFDHPFAFKKTDFN